MMGGVGGGSKIIPNCVTSFSHDPLSNLLDDVVDDFGERSVFVLSVDLGGFAGDVHLALDVVDGVLLEGLLQ